MSLKINTDSSLIKAFVFAMFISMIFISCDRKENGTPETGVVKDTTVQMNENLIMQKVQEQVKGKLEFFEKGNFTEANNKTGYIAGTEFDSGNTIGIKISYFEPAANSVEKKFETPLLEGSFTSAIVKKINLQGIQQDLLYLNTGAYFIGSGGGEVYAYVFDFNENKTYYAHFISVPKLPVSLYISPETNEQTAIKDFLFSEFKKDYPDIKLVKKDHKLEEVF